MQHVVGDPSNQPGVGKVRVGFNRFELCDRCAQLFAEAIRHRIVVHIESSHVEQADVPRRASSQVSKPDLAIRLPSYEELVRRRSKQIMVPAHAVGCQKLGIRERIARYIEMRHQHVDGDQKIRRAAALETEDVGEYLVDRGALVEPALAPGLQRLEPRGRRILVALIPRPEIAVRMGEEALALAEVEGEAIVCRRVLVGIECDRFRNQRPDQSQAFDGRGVEQIEERRLRR